MTIKRAAWASEIEPRPPSPGLIEALETEFKYGRNTRTFSKINWSWSYWKSWLFALFLAIVGFVLTINVDRIRTSWEQGEKIATARIDAYRELLESAYDLQKEPQIFYQPSPAFGMDILERELAEYKLRWLEAIGDSSCADSEDCGQWMG